MFGAIESFLTAHEWYLALDNMRTYCLTPQQREKLHIEVMSAYLEVQQRAQLVAQLQLPEGRLFPPVN